jgi:hypothetical protein
MEIKGVIKCTEGMILLCVMLFRKAHFQFGVLVGR